MVFSDLTGVFSFLHAIPSVTSTLRHWELSGVEKDEKEAGELTMLESEEGVTFKLDIFISMMTHRIIMPLCQWPG